MVFSIRMNLFLNFHNQYCVNNPYCKVRSWMEKIKRLKEGQQNNSTITWISDSWQLWLYYFLFFGSKWEGVSARSRHQTRYWTILILYHVLADLTNWSCPLHRGSISETVDVQTLNVSALIVGSDLQYCTPKREGMGWNSCWGDSTLVLSLLRIEKNPLLNTRKTISPIVQF